MTALTFDANLRFIGPVYTEVLKLSLTPATIQFWKGAPVILDLSEATDGVVPADGVTMVTGDVFVGIAAARASSTSSQTEATEMEVYVWPTIVGFPNATIALDDLGKRASMSDSGTLTVTGGAYPAIGSVYSVRDGFVYVLLDPPTPM